MFLHVFSLPLTFHRVRSCLQLEDRQKLQERQIKAFEEARADLAGYRAEGIFAGDGERKRMDQVKQEMLKQQAVMSNVRHGSQTPPPKSIATPAGRGTDWRPQPAARSGRGTPSSSMNMDQEEQLRQMRYPGVKPVAAKPRSARAEYAPPFSRPGVESPIVRPDLAVVAARGAAWAAKREKPAEGRAEWNPQNHQRLGDAMPFRAERVEEQLRRAAVQGEAARALAEAKKGPRNYG